MSKWVARLWWPVLRIGGFVADGADRQRGDRARAREDRAVGGACLRPGAARCRYRPALSIFSGAGVLAAVQEVLIGVAIGMVVQLAFEALTFAGQSISLTMGLGFATLVDPQHGADTPVLGQLFMIFGTLTYLADQRHLVLIGALAKSFRKLPIGGAQHRPEFPALGGRCGARGCSRPGSWSRSRR